MRRLQTRAQFQAAMAGGVIARTAHFALHRLVLHRPAPPTACPATPHQPVPPEEPASTLEAQALFAVAAAPEQSCALWVGAMAPKRWARRAVTRNAIKRQVYTLFDPHVHPPAGQLPQAAFVVRLSKAFDRKRYPSAWSEALRLAVRAELEQLLARATRPTTPPCAPPGEQA